ncbi:hypothetical protein CHARACLAT_028148 [Characodon lateralis]|uniref:Uncharacterized protein n=1 Tax=Characodon lateralis TaxID=208331 RepID=A0ABU7DM94_9TELE|nr:hypothetical protein [Characodon lateralis]
MRRYSSIGAPRGDLARLIAAGLHLAEQLSRSVVNWKMVDPCGGGFLQLFWRAPSGSTRKVLSDDHSTYETQKRVPKISRPVWKRRR